MKFEVIRKSARQDMFYKTEAGVKEAGKRIAKRLGISDFIVESNKYIIDGEFKFVGHVYLDPTDDAVYSHLIDDENNTATASLYLNGKSQRIPKNPISVQLEEIKSIVKSRNEVEIVVDARADQLATQLKELEQRYEQQRLELTASQQEVEALKDELQEYKNNANQTEDKPNLAPLMTAFRGDNADQVYEVAIDVKVTTDNAGCDIDDKLVLEVMGNGETVVSEADVEQMLMDLTAEYCQAYLLDQDASHIKIQRNL